MPTLAPCLYPKAQVENAGSRSLGRCCSVAFLKQQKAEGLAVLSTEAAAETLREFPWQSGNDFSSGVLLGGLHLEEKEKLQTELADPSLGGITQLICSCAGLSFLSSPVPRENCK